MRVFLYEHVTGGGLMGQPLPASLAREGEMMLRAALDDLTQLPGVEVVISRDPRLPSLTEAAAVLRPAPGESWRALYLRGLALAELVWPIAPETGGVLETLTQYAVAEGRRLLGCTPQAVRVAASKHATACVLARAGIPVVPTFAPGEALPDIAGPWVVKPDDGAGCEGARRVADVRAARHQLMAAAAALVAQPWIEGEPASLSLLVFPDGRVELLACNRQHVALRGERLVLAGVTVNATADTDGRMRGLAQRIVRAIPGLAGFVGVDYLLTADGPLVLEVNPRLTTSYCGLKSALGVNPAALLLGAGVEPERLGTATGPVTLTLDAAHA
ncbi:ATP-grasp domain-containing protein [Pelomicrobium methylotrophicum]|uniref:ATP-grasp domain-containing protein n=1 Tax=Pelomicrobium methylotrophicum TaxID=2602750 RepID=A0A5C7EZL9_9PROT|nr:ATP-grasp domain-containing protein [Pelomicrobium methylotrophicum]TXF12585.1 ATP-grasp domain-containing protein [Pelomicrobium methylotrophicum]